MAPPYIIPVGAYSDNYMYLIIDAQTGEAAAVDPVQPEKVIAEAQRLGARITTVLTTHSHGDHDGGNVQIKRMLPSVIIYGGKGDGVSAVMHEVGDGDRIQVGTLIISVLFTPGHTPGHVCYYLDTEGFRAVFTGDTLFIGGCGNINYGPPSLMHQSFIKLASLPDDTRVYVGHEYTVANLQYASFVEPQNVAVARKLQWAKTQPITVPSIMGEEKEYNPFVRAALGFPTVLQHCNTADPVTAFKFVRTEKSAGQWKSYVQLN